MSFAAEMKDFIAGFQATSQIGDRMSQRRLRDAQADRLRQPTDAELGGVGDPFADPAPQVSSGKGPQGSPESNAIASIESGGRYDAVGPETGGDRPYGKHQVMGKNIGPWTKEVLGKSLTPQQYLADPDAQEKVFDAKFGQYVKQFGLQGAAQAWLGGPGSVGKLGRKDANGTSVGSYGDQFMAALGKAGGGTQVARVPQAIPAPEDPTAVDTTDTTAPEDAAPAADDGSSPDAGIQLDPVDVSLGPTPQVQGWDKPLYAEHGGAIPAFAGGGLASGNPNDPYNPSRAYTQALPRQADNGWRPRMIGDPGAVPTYTGMTPSQKLLHAREPVTPTGTPEVPRPPVQPNVQAIYAPGRGYGPNQTPRGRTSQGGGVPNPVIPGGGQRVRGDANKMILNGTTYAFSGRDAMWIPLDASGKPMMQNTRGWAPVPPPVDKGVLQNGQVIRPAHPYMERGGAIPDPQNFARGGAVENNRDPGYTSSKSYYRPGERRYAAHQDEEYWTPRKKTASKGGSARPVTKPGKRSSKSSTPDASSGVPVPMGRPDEGFSPDLAVSPPRAAMNWDNPPGPDVARQVPSAIPTDPRAADQSVAPRVPDVVRPARSEQAMPVQPESVAPAHARDFAATRSAPRLVPVIDNAGNLIGYTPSEQNGVRPDAMLSPNLPAQGIPAVPGWMEKERASEGGYVPLETQLFGPPAYARGGRIDGGADNDPGYTSSQSYRRPGEDAPDTQDDHVQATPVLMDHVAQALDGGVKFLSQRFGLTQRGGVPDPAGDGAMQQDNVKRFAMGEGAATPEEVAQVDQHLDPERKLNEGDRQMTRLAKMTQWYLQQGRPKDAQASAAALMQYGANRFSRLGALAAAAYDDYQQTGDKSDLQKTSKFLQSAYEMIPDGAQVDVELKGDRLMATRTSADGQTQQFEVTPQQLPQMIRGVMDKSGYWQSIFRLADPAGARQQASWAHQAATTADTRAYNEQAGLAKESRADARATARQQAGFEHSDKAAAAAADRADKRAAKTRKEPVNYDAVSPLLAAATKANATLTASPDDPAAKTALDQSMSQLYDALPAGIDRAKWIFSNTGLPRESWDYVGGQDPNAPVSGSVGAGGVTINGQPQPASAPPAAPAAPAVANLPANIYKGDAAPTGMPNAKRARDGSWWMVPPGGGKPMAIVTGQ